MQRLPTNWATLWALAFSLLPILGCHPSSSLANGPKAAPERSEAPKPVKVITAASSSQELVVKTVGTLASLDRATLSTKVAGRIESIAVDLGDEVRQGELLAQIEPHDYRLRVQQAEAFLSQARARLGLPLAGTNDEIESEQTSIVRQARAVLDEARAEQDRIASLSEQGIISRSELETAQSAFKVAASRYEDAVYEVKNRQATIAQRRAELEIARKQLADTAIHAPFDGVIQERRAGLGEYLSEGTPLVTLVRMNPLRLRMELPEKEAPQIRVGQKVRLTLEGDTNVYVGETKRLSPVIEELNRMLRVEADVTNSGRLRPGAFARAEIVINDQAPAILLPAKSVVTFAGIEKVFLVRQGNAVEGVITTGRRGVEFVEIAEGVKPGDVVVLDPAGLRAGEAIVPVN